jgi:hypothetical protein
MEEFDIKLSMNGVQDELNHSVTGDSATDLWGRKKGRVSPRDKVSKLEIRHSVTGDSATDLWGGKKGKVSPRDKVSKLESRGNVSKIAQAQRIGFDGEIEQTQQKSWTDTLNKLTQDFKEITDFKTNEQIKEQKEREEAEKGTRYKILGMNPFVAVTLSFLVVIGGSYALTRIKS